MVGTALEGLTHPGRSQTPSLKSPKPATKGPPIHHRSKQCQAAAGTGPASASRTVSHHQRPRTQAGLPETQRCDQGQRLQPARWPPPLSRGLALHLRHSLWWQCPEQQAHPCDAGEAWRPRRVLAWLGELATSGLAWGLPGPHHNSKKCWTCLTRESGDCDPPQFGAEMRESMNPSSPERKASASPSFTSCKERSRPWRCAEASSGIPHIH